VSHGGAARRLLLAGFVALAGCIPSNVVARKDRMVVTDVADLKFEPAPGLALAGLFESVEITGDAALALRKVWYLFRADGTCSAAALAEQDGTLRFQTRDGTWVSSAAGLSLDGASPVLLEKAEGHLRITTPDGALVLRQGVVQ
jgi:hypothetical protein